MLRGVPQAMADRVSEILVEINPEHQIVRIVIDDVDGSTTEYRFSEQKENVAIPAGKFEFKPPAGTETVEGEARALRLARFDLRPIRGYLRYWKYGSKLERRCDWRWEAGMLD